MLPEDRRSVNRYPLATGGLSVRQPKSIGDPRTIGQSSAGYQSADSALSDIRWISIVVRRSLRGVSAARKNLSGSGGGVLMDRPGAPQLAPGDAGRGAYAR